MMFQCAFIEKVVSKSGRTSTPSDVMVYHIDLISMGAGVLYSQSDLHKAVFMVVGV